MLSPPTVSDSGTIGDTRMLDAAEGVLVALRRCTMSDAFSEIVGIAARNQIGVLAMSRALVELAAPSARSAGAAAEAARRAWAHLLVVDDG